MNNNDNDRYPHTPGTRAGSPETAFDAARSMHSADKTRQGRALAFVGTMSGYGATAHEIERAFGWERQSSMPRLAELSNAGLIAASGNTRPGKSGRQQTVWVLPWYAPGKASFGQDEMTAAAV